MTKYPKKWRQISLRVRAAAAYRCQRCSRQCLPPGKRGEPIERRVRARLSAQTHHINRNVRDNRQLNLVCVCRACHLELHRGDRFLSPGQLSLSLEVEHHPVWRHQRKRLPAGNFWRLGVGIQLTWIVTAERKRSPPGTQLSLKFQSRSAQESRS